VRLLWLVSGLKVERGTAPGKDLAPVVEELAHLGIADLRVVANAFVSVRGSQFTLQGTPELEGPVRLDMSGKLNWEAADRPVLGVELRVRGAENGSIDAKAATGSSPNVLSLSSAIDAPYGQFVVLGAAPIGNLNSVFVLQVTPK
jgi:hypothetical protein